MSKRSFFPQTNAWDRGSGFTLIELLIVVAIIAILAAIAVPNFLEAQTRSKVSRARTDMRSVATALESYFTDYNKYPPCGYTFWGMGVFDNSDPRFNHYNTVKGACYLLTSPVSYLSSIPESAFFKQVGSSIDTTDPNNFSFAYTEHRPGNNGWSLGGWADDPNGKLYGMSQATQWYVLDPGPDLKFFFIGVNSISAGIAPPYDPTNGTVSYGDIIRFGP